MSIKTIRFSWRVDRQTIRVWTPELAAYGAFEVISPEEFEAFKKSIALVNKMALSDHYAVDEFEYGFNDGDEED